jgi:hypothetical protein
MWWAHAALVHPFDLALSQLRFAHPTRIQVQRNVGWAKELASLFFASDVPTSVIQNQAQQYAEVLQYFPILYHTNLFQHHA